MTYSKSDRRREMRPAVASIVMAALRLRLHLTPEERRGQREQARIEIEERKDQQ